MVCVPFDHIPLARTGHVGPAQAGNWGLLGGAGEVQVECQVSATEDCVGDKFIEAQA